MLLTRRGLVVWRIVDCRLALLLEVSLRGIDVEVGQMRGCSYFSATSVS